MIFFSGRPKHGVDIAAVFIVPALCDSRRVASVAVFHENDTYGVSYVDYNMHKTDTKRKRKLRYTPSFVLCERKTKSEKKTSVVA